MSKVCKLKQALKDVSSVYIQTHNFPDPDAIAAAFALQFVLKQFNIKSRIIYSGFIASKTMKEMIKKLKIKVYHVNKINIDPLSGIILVDTQLSHENVTRLKAKYMGCIDHHEPGNKAGSHLFTDLQQDRGATSTIIGEYILDLKIKDIPSSVATAILIGIYIDTFRLSRKVSQADVRIVSELFPFADISFLNYLTVNNIDLKDLPKFQESINELKVMGDIGIINAKDLKSQQLLAILCDFFIQLREITLVIGYYSKKSKISISVRSEKKEYNASKIVSRITRKIGAGGGHTTMAAGIVDLSLVRKNFNFENYLTDIIRKLL